MVPWTDGNVLSYIGIVYVTSTFQKVNIQFLSCPVSVSPLPATCSQAEMLTTSNPSPNTQTQQNQLLSFRDDQLKSQETNVLAIVFVTTYLIPGESHSFL